MPARVPVAPTPAATRSQRSKAKSGAAKTAGTEIDCSAVVRRRRRGGSGRRRAARRHAPWRPRRPVAVAIPVTIALTTRAATATADGNATAPLAIAAAAIAASQSASAGRGILGAGSRAIPMPPARPPRRRPRAATSRPPKTAASEDRGAACDRDHRGEPTQRLAAVAPRRTSTVAGRQGRDGHVQGDRSIGQLPTPRQARPIRPPRPPQPADATPQAAPAMAAPTRRARRDGSAGAVIDSGRRGIGP